MVIFSQIVVIRGK